MVYEAILVAALIVLLSLLFPGAATGHLSPASRYALSFYLFSTVSAYFIWSWTHGGTLAMRAWRLRVVDVAGRALTARRASLRLLAAGVPIALLLGAVLWLREHPDSLLGWLAAAPALIGVTSGLWDRDRQCLYDRVSGTRLIVLDRPS